MVQGVPHTRTPLLLERTPVLPGGTPPSPSATCEAASAMVQADAAPPRPPPPLPGPAPAPAEAGGAAEPDGSRSGDGSGVAAAAGGSLGATGRLRCRRAGGLAGQPCPPPVPPLAPAPPPAPPRRRPGAAGGDLSCREPSVRSPPPARESGSLPCPGNRFGRSPRRSVCLPQQPRLGGRCVSRTGFAPRRCWSR